jgi:hypothetical protein
MKTKFIVGVSLLLAAIFINACENKQGAVPLTVVIPNSCDTTNLTYSSGPNKMDSIINVQCGTNNHSCHSPGSISGYDYTSYATIYSNYQKGWLYSSIFLGTPTQMPKVQQPGWDQCTKDKFKAWIDLGCPQ